LTPGATRGNGTRARRHAILQRLRAVVTPMVLAALLPGLEACAAAAVDATAAASEALRRLPSLDRAIEDRILALDPQHISAAEVRDVLRHAPAPRIIGMQGSSPLITMQPFAQYLIAMGYPEERLRDPRDGSMSMNVVTSCGSSARPASCLSIARALSELSAR